MVILRTYEEYKNWDDHYIVCVPSGEIIYTNKVNIFPLLNMKYIRFDNKLMRYVCDDLFYKRVSKFISDRSESEIELRTKSSINKFLMECGLLDGQFEIKEDLSVDAHGPVNMSNRNLKKIPIKFNRCTSDFICSHNKLETLENSPFSVHGNFNCSNNNLTNLKGGPRLVSGAYNCSNNYLVSLDGAPLKLKVFNCSNNQLKDLDKAPIVTEIMLKNGNKFR